MLCKEKTVQMKSLPNTIPAVRSSAKSLKLLEVKIVISSLLHDLACKISVIGRKHSRNRLSLIANIHKCPHPRQSASSLFQI